MLNFFNNAIKDIINDEIGIDDFDFDVAVKHVNANEKNLSQQEIFDVVKDFNDKIDEDILDPDEFKILTNDIIHNVKDENLKFNMLEVLNRKSKVHHISEPVKVGERVGLKLSFGNKDIIKLPPPKKIKLSRNNINDELRKKIIKTDSHPHITKQSIKGFYIHNPHNTYNIGNIQILEDITHSKEIILHKDINMNDLVKLSHALQKEKGILINQSGNQIIDFTKDPNIKDIIIKLIEEVKKNKNDTIRFLFKNQSPIGGVFTGILGQKIYNKHDKHKLFKRIN